MRAVAVFLDDRFVEIDEARVRADDRGLLLGDGVFVTMRARRGRCFARAEHLRRLGLGADLFGLVLPRPLEALGELAEEAARRSGETDAYVRVTMTRTAAGGTTLLVMARALEVPPESLRAAGARVGWVGPRRPPPSCADPWVKTTSYAASVLARREAERRGLDEGLQLAVDGAVASGTMANVFALRGDHLVTPPLDSGCRAGVTRGVVIELARELGLSIAEDVVSPEALGTAEEVFLTSTRIGCLPVAEIEGRRVAAAPASPRTRALHAALEARIEAEAT